MGEFVLYVTPASCTESLLRGGSEWPQNVKLCNSDPKFMTGQSTFMSLYVKSDVMASRVITNLHSIQLPGLSRYRSNVVVLTATNQIRVMVRYFNTNKC